MNRPIILALAACTLAVGFGLYQFSPAAKDTPNTASGSETAVDITFVLGDELLATGGLVKLIVRPGATNEDRHKDVEIHLSSKASIVYVDLGVDETYTYRFTRADNGQSGTTDRFSVGSYRQENGQADAAIYDHHIDFGPGWPLTHSRKLAALLDIHDPSRHACTDNLNISICDASASIPGDMLQ